MKSLILTLLLPLVSSVALPLEGKPTTGVPREDILDLELREGPPSTVVPRDDILDLEFREGPPTTVVPRDDILVLEERSPTIILRGTADRTYTSGRFKRLAQGSPLVVVLRGDVSALEAKVPIITNPDTRELDLRELPPPKLFPRGDDVIVPGISDDPHGAVFDPVSQNRSSFHSNSF
ncbi:hypothetical protein DL96DRAFT_1820929 [Flagelloscypha sp. PMI_526]|nr:hypothetical protein DL96DRAFT_1820929 [Flagelloscypha sp. PMI_526]